MSNFLDPMDEALMESQRLSEKTMTLVQVQDEPTEGRYVVMWEYDGQLWSDTIECAPNGVTRYSEYLDGFMLVSQADITWRKAKANPTFYVLE